MTGVLERPHALRIPFPSVTSGAVTSMPSLTRSGLPRASFASRPPSGSTLTAFRVSSDRPIAERSSAYNPLALVSAHGSQGERLRRRRIRKLRLLALLVVLGLVGTASFAFGLVTAIASELPKLDPARYKPSKNDRNSYIYTSDGRVLAVLRGSEARIVVKSEEISDVMKQAIVAVEDRRFEHRGVDLRGIACDLAGPSTAPSSRAARRSRSNL